MTDPHDHAAEVPSDRSPCPRCGTPLLPVVYGFPGHELFEAAARQEVALGGCVIGLGNASHRCANGHGWVRRRNGGSTRPAPHPDPLAAVLRRGRAARSEEPPDDDGWEPAWGDDF